jgi:hypothetical protein
VVIHNKKQCSLVKGGRLKMPLLGGAQINRPTLLTDQHLGRHHSATKNIVSLNHSQPFNVWKQGRQRTKKAARRFNTPDGFDSNASNE